MSDPLKAVQEGGEPLAQLVDDRFATRQAFADACNLPSYAVSRLCSGVREPTPMQVEQMAAALKIAYEPHPRAPASVVECRRSLDVAHRQLAAARETNADLRTEIRSLKGREQRLLQRMLKIADLAVGG